MSHNTEVTTGANSAPAIEAEALVASTSTAAAAPADPNHTRLKIAQHIIRHSVPAPLPAVWSFLAPINVVRSLSCTPPELVASLQSSFSPAELEAAQVLITRPNEPVQLSPVLSEPRFHMLFGDDDDKSIKLVSDAGSLFGDDPPCFHFARQRLAAANKPQRIFVAPLADLQIFHCLGLQCTPAADLAHLSGEQVRHLYAGLSRRTPPRYRLTLVGMGLACLDPELPAHITPVIERMMQIEVLFGHGSNIPLFDVWQPSRRDVRRIKAAVTFSDRKIVDRAIHNSLDHSVRSYAHAWQRLHEPAEGDLAHAHWCLRQAMSSRGKFSDSELPVAIKRLSSMLERATTKRYLQEAAAVPHPLTSTALILMAEISQNVNRNCGLLANARQYQSSPWQTFDPQPWSEERLVEIERTFKLITKVRPLLLPKC